MNEALAYLLALPLLMIMLGMIIVLVGFVFWVMMIIDCLENEEENKTAWILTLIFLTVFGAILYYTIAKKKKWLINTIFIGGVLILATIIITVAYLGKYGNTIIEAQKTTIRNNYISQPVPTKHTINTQLPILNLPFNFTHNKTKRNKSIYLPKPTTPAKIYRTQKTRSRYAAQKKYIYTWKDEKQQDHYSNMLPPAGTQYTRKESLY